MSSDVPTAGGVARGVVPEPYFDETTAPPRPTPDAWLVLGDVIRLAPAIGFPAPTGALEDGQTIRFFELTDYPILTLELRADGHAIDVAPPAIEGLMFMLPGDADTIAESVEALADTCRDDGYELGHYRVLVYHWDDGTLYRLRGGRFEVAS